MSVFTSLLALPFATGIICIFAACACLEITNRLDRKKREDPKYRKLISSVKIPVSASRHLRRHRYCPSCQRLSNAPS